MEARLYEKLENQTVMCHVCVHECKIPEGKRGICGVRENRRGTLFALNYGYTIASAIDPIEKKPLYHFHPGTRIYSLATVGCNLRCSWCQNHEISQSPKPNKNIEGIYISPEEHLERALRTGCPSIAYTYSEPTIFFEYALDIMRLAKEKGLYNVWVTNGAMSDQVLDEILPYLDAANVDYKGPDDDIYRAYCGGPSGPVVHNIERMLSAGVHVEITTLLIPDVNDSEDQIRQIAKTIASRFGTSVPWHITRFFPAWKMKDHPFTPLKTLELAERIAYEEGIETVHIGNVW